MEFKVNVSVSLSKKTFEYGSMLEATIEYPRWRSGDQVALYDAEPAKKADRNKPLVGPFEVSRPMDNFSSVLIPMPQTARGKHRILKARKFEIRYLRQKGERWQTISTSEWDGKDTLKELLLPGGDYPLRAGTFHFRGGEHDEGIFFHLGRKGKQQSKTCAILGNQEVFVNPCESKEVSVHVKGEGDKNSQVSGVVGRNPNFVYRIVRADLPIIINLQHHIVVPTAYRLSFQEFNISSKPHHWFLEGLTRDVDAKWIQINAKQLTMSEDDNEIFEAGTIVFIVSTRAAFSKLRLVRPGNDQSKELIVPRLEVFGYLNPLEVKVSYPIWDNFDVLAVTKDGAPDNLKHAIESISLEDAPRMPGKHPRLFCQVELLSKSLKKPSSEPPTRCQLRYFQTMEGDKVVNIGTSKEFTVKNYSSRVTDSSLRFEGDPGFLDIIRLFNQHNKLPSNPVEISSCLQPKSVIEGLTVEQDRELRLFRRWKKSASFDPEKSVAATNEMGETLLMYAAAYGRSVFVHELLMDGFDPNARDAYGETALMRACFGGHTEIVEMLLEKKAAPSLADNGGVTPMMLAAEGGHEQIVNLLLKFEANDSSKSHAGFTALDLAHHNKQAQIAETLETWKLLHEREG